MSNNNIPDLEWSKLPFGYVPTDYNVRCTYRDGKWGEIEVSQSPTIDMHIAATALHYGQEIFEGLKAFRGADGKSASSVSKKTPSVCVARPKL